ncbi:MAG: selenide, water dikinase SelD [Thermosynechococcaceae cyanobacterium]
MYNPQPITKDLVLIGGGHSHAIAIHQFIMQPLPGIRLTLISTGSNTPYSGMLPGHVAGLYSYDDCHIDLRPLANAAQAQFYLDQVVGLDLDNQRVLCANRPPVGFDALSIDIGSTPELPDIPGAIEYSIPVKPWDQFLSQWQRLIAQVKLAPTTPICLAVVGGGAGGVELALTIQYQIQQILQTAEQPLDHVQVHLFHRGDQVMTGHNGWVRNRFHRILERKGIHLHLEKSVQEVHAGIIYCKSGFKLTCDRIFWVTRASAPLWPRAAGLATDDRGFIQVSPTLQSISHPPVFAAGDIAAMVQSPRPKAGVFAVRQGRPLAQNLRRFLIGEPLGKYRPQRQILGLISTGDRNAVLSWGPLPWGWESPRLWRWKDRIDRKFMDQFKNLPLPMMAPPAAAVDPVMHCAGCGSKVGSSVLERTLQRVRHTQPSVSISGEIIIGLDTADDAAVVAIPPGNVIAHTLDYFRSLINDPFVFGQICTHHSLSDLFAMGATPQTALALASLPYASDTKLEETLFQLLSGATQVLHEAGAALVGGHTTEGNELAFGLSCNGFMERDRILRKSNLKPDQALILTKPLGTGTLFAADMRLQAKGRWIDAAVESMLQSNQAAAACLIKYQASACTDITGFGLLGHLLEMIKTVPVSVDLDLDALSPLPGAMTCLEQGFFSSLHPQNLQASQQINNIDESQAHPHWHLLFDPQTSGGLLGAVPADQVLDCLADLQALGYSYSRQVGWVIPAKPLAKPIRCLMSKRR